MKDRRCRHGRILLTEFNKTKFVLYVSTIVFPLDTKWCQQK